MIRFCDKVIYNIREGEMSRGEILTFFLSDKEHLSSVIAVYEELGEKFIGIITYHSIISGETMDSCMISDTIQVTENFWEQAHSYFEKKPDELLTVIDKNNAILGFAYDDKISGDYAFLFGLLEMLETHGIPALKDRKYQNVKMLVITDLNELAWKTKNVFGKYGIQICVLGEKWEWFGYKSGEGYLDCAEFEKIYIYAEGNDFLREKIDFSVLRGVGYAFKGIREIAVESTKYIYEEERTLLIKKGVPVFEFAIPDVKTTIAYRTEQEWQSLELGSSPEDALKNGVSDKKKSCIENIYGRDTVKRIVEHGTVELLSEASEKCLCGELVGRTLDKPDFRKKRIYLLGPCIAGGYGCLPKDTLLAALSQRMGECGYQIVAISMREPIYGKWKEVEKIPIRQGDMVCVIAQQSWLPKRDNNCKRIDLSYVYNNRERKTMFCKRPIHTNAEGNRVLAKEIYENYLKDEMVRWKDCKRDFLQKGEILNRDMIAEIAAYTDRIRHEGDGTIGCIVMNCNPFTYGHRYLIEYAAKRVDILYIFVVEEERSVFKFEDRMQMVKEGTSGLGEGAIVVPSGRWVLSYDTMPIYFEKAVKQEAVVDAGKDLEIFARYIAPQLGITKRFVGEEPTDRITRQYNEQMQEILSDFDIEVEIVPRKEIDGEIVSASKVRAYIEEGNWEAVKRLVPESTMRILRG